MSSLNAVFGSSPYTDNSKQGGSIMNEWAADNKLSAGLELGALVCLLVAAMAIVLTNGDGSSAATISTVFAWLGLVLLVTSNIYSWFKRDELYNA
jgi:hypothetical protein